MKTEIHLKYFKMSCSVLPVHSFVQLLQRQCLVSFHLPLFPPQSLQVWEIQQQFQYFACYILFINYTVKNVGQNLRYRTIYSSVYCCYEQHRGSSSLTK